jgi:kynurenine formamidase
LPKWLKEVDNAAGEWSVTDLQRGYRICRFNHQSHSGTHLHAPILATAGDNVPVTTLADAAALCAAVAAASAVLCKRARRYTAKLYLARRRK